MRQRATKERRRERQEFVYQYREEILKLETAGRYETEKFINQYARPLLNYSSRTYWFDIYMSLKRTMLKMIM